MALGALCTLVAADFTICLGSEHWLDSILTRCKHLAAGELPRCTEPKCGALSQKAPRGGSAFASDGKGNLKVDEVKKTMGPAPGFQAPVQRQAHSFQLEQVDVEATLTTLELGGDHMAPSPTPGVHRYPMFGTGSPHHE